MLNKKNAVSLLAFIVVAGSSSTQAADVVLPPQSPMAGRPPAQLAAEWWQWAMSAPEEENPVEDQTGAHCGVGQGGPVWFLAGGFGSSKIRRTCTMPAGKALFFPVINMMYWRHPKNPSYTCPQAIKAAALNNDTAIDLFAEIDGVAVPDVKRYRVASEKCFDAFARLPADQRPFDAYPSATDGYWLMLKPLPAGRHVLKFGGRYNRNSQSYGHMVQDIEYELIVK